MWKQSIYGLSELEHRACSIQPGSEAMSRPPLFQHREEVTDFAAMDDGPSDIAESASDQLLDHGNFNLHHYCRG